MHTSPRIVSLATALASLGVPMAAQPIANASDSEGAPLTAEADAEIQAKAKMRPPGDVELMSFTAHPGGDDIPAHSSHSSHSSHVSHASGSPGFGVPDVPYAPNPVYVPPVAPAPIYSPPVAPTSPTTPPPSGYVSDPRYLACTQASVGTGVNDIASALEQQYAMSESDAVSMAKEALAAVLTGGHYCDGYLGDHE